MLLHPSTFSEPSRHRTTYDFLHRELSVLEILQALLTDHEIKAAVRNGALQSRQAMPLTLLTSVATKPVRGAPKLPIIGGGVDSYVVSPSSKNGGRRSECDRA
jgi:hypothetical protein